MTRPWRGATLEITIERVRDLPAGVTAEVTVDGAKLATPVIAVPLAPGVHKVHVRCT